MPIKTKPHRFSVTSNMRKIIIFAVSFILCSCAKIGSRDDSETMEEYYKRNPVTEQNLFRITSSNRHALSRLITANGGTVTGSASVFSAAGIKAEITVQENNSAAADEFINYRCDILVLSLSAYTELIGKLISCNPRVFAVAGFSRGMHTICGLLPDKSAKIQAGTSGSDPSSLSYLCPVIFGFTAELTDSVKTLNFCDVSEENNSGNIILSSESFPYYEPYIMISRKYFIADRKEKLSSLVSAMYDFNTTAMTPAEKTASKPLYAPAVFNEASMFFGNSTDNAVFIRMCRLRNGSETFLNRIIPTFEPYFIDSLRRNRKQEKYNAPAGFYKFTCTIKPTDGLLTQNDMIAIEPYLDAASAMAPHNVKIITYGFSDYSSESTAVKRIKNRLISAGYSPNTVTEERNRAAAEDAKIALIFGDK